MVEDQLDTRMSNPTGLVAPKLVGLPAGRFGH